MENRISFPDIIEEYLLSSRDRKGSGYLMGKGVNMYLWTDLFKCSIAIGKLNGLVAESRLHMKREEELQYYLSELAEKKSDLERLEAKIRKDIEQWKEKRLETMNGQNEKKEKKLVHEMVGETDGKIKDERVYYGSDPCEGNKREQVYEKEGRGDGEWKLQSDRGIVEEAKFGIVTIAGTDGANTPNNDDGKDEKNESQSEETVGCFGGFFRRILNSCRRKRAKWARRLR